MRHLTVAIAALLIPLLMVSTVSALDPLAKPCDDVPGAAACQEPDTNPIYGPDGVLSKAIMLISFVVGLASVIMVIYGGLRYVTSNGDSNNTSAAKNTILYALIGLGVAAAAQFIVRFVLNRVT